MTINLTPFDIQIVSGFTGFRCSICKKYSNNYLGSKLRLIQNQTEEQGAMSCAADSHVNYCYLDTPEKFARMKNLNSVVRKQNAQIKTLKQKVGVATALVIEVLWLTIKLVRGLLS